MSIATSRTVTGLTNGTEYQFRVRARSNLAGEWANVVATPSAVVGDPEFASVSLLLHMDGSNGSTTFTDSSSNSFSATRSGAAAISTSQSKFGGASAAFSGGTSSDAIWFADADAFDFGTGDFTLECWAYINGVPSNVNALISKYGSGGAEWILWINNAGKLQFYTDAGSVTSSSSVPTGQWTFLSATRSSGTVKVFIDGVEEGSGSRTNNFNGGATLAIGNYPAFGSYNHGYGIAVDGFMDDVRITKGVARTIVVPTAAFPEGAAAPSSTDPDFASVSLLLHADGADGSTTFTDSSSAAKTVNRFGSAQISTAQSKFGGSSGRLQSGGDYLSMTHGTSFGTGDFTIEAWLYSAWDTNDNHIFEFRSTVNLTVWINSGGAVWTFTPNTSFGNRATIAANQWVHFAFVRDSGTVRLYLDGVQAWSGSDSGSLDTSGNLYIGRAFDNLRTPNFFFDDYRISTICRYPSGTTFTPPTAAFPDQ